MKFKGHFFWTFIYLFAINFIIEPVSLALIFIIAFISLICDADLRLYRNSHRFIWLHSLFIPLIAFLYYPHVITLMILLAVGHHLALDTVSNLILGKEAKGYYTICLIPTYTFNFLLFKITTKGWRLGGKLSTIWLLSNWFLSLIILGVWLL